MNLFKALSYKEWIKTRRIIGVLLLITIATIAYSFIEINHNIRVEGAVNEWYMFLYMDAGLPSVTQYLPLISGVILALVQFVPEMINKRLKLTLHLPADEGAIVHSMLGYGYLVLLLLFALTIIAYIVGMSLIFPCEITNMMNARLLPAFVAGFMSYGYTAWICFEPRWKQRVLDSFVAIALTAVLFVSVQSAVYTHFVIGLVVLIISSSVFPFISVKRFKQGVI